MPTSASPPSPDDGQDPIPARRATHGQASRSPWGSDDQIGMLNLVTPASVAGVLSEVDAHKVFDLAVDYFVGMPAWTDWGDPPFTFWMTATPSGGVVDDVAGLGAETMRRASRSSDAMSMFTHTGTHIDALNHFGHEGMVWNCYDVREHLGSQHWNVCGADRHPPVISRGVLIDVAGAHGVDVLPDFYGIDAEGAGERSTLAEDRGPARRRGVDQHRSSYGLAGRHAIHTRRARTNARRCAVSRRGWGDHDRSRQHRVRG